MKVRCLSFIVLLSLIIPFGITAAQDTTALPLTQTHCLTDDLFDIEIMFSYPETWVADTLTTQFGDVDFITSTERSASAFQASEGSLQADMFESGEVVMILNYIDTDSLESITGAEITDAASALDADLSFNGIATSSEIETIQIGDRTVARAGYAPTFEYEGAVYGMIVDNLFILVRAFARVGDYASQEASVQAILGSVNAVCDESASNFEPEIIQPVLPVAYGETVTGVMSDSETTTYTFSGSAGDSLIITMSAEDFDPILALRSSTGQLLIESTNYSGGDAILEFTLTANSSYTIVPGVFFEQQNGEYQLSVEENPSGMNRVGDPAIRLIAYNQPAENEIMVDGADVDYQFYAQEGDLITITLDAVGFQPFFRLLGGGGLADTFGSEGSHLQLQYLIRETRPYYIRVTGVDGFPNPSNGTYILSVTVESGVQPTSTPDESAESTIQPTLAPDENAPAVSGDGALVLTETFISPDSSLSISYPQGWFTTYQSGAVGTTVYVTNYPGEPRKVEGWGEGEYFIECSRDTRQDFSGANIAASITDRYGVPPVDGFETIIVDGIEWTTARIDGFSLHSEPQTSLFAARIAGNELHICEAITHSSDIGGFAPTALAIMTSFSSQSDGVGDEAATPATSTPLAPTLEPTSAPSTEVALAGATPIAYDQPITGTTTPGAVDAYEFPGTTGQYVRVVFESPDACYTLVPPGNYQLMADADGDPYYGLRLPLDGAYQVLVQSVSGAAANNYTLTVVHDLGIEYGNQGILAVGGAAEVFTEDEGLKLRSGAGTNFDIIETMPPGTIVEIIGGPTSSQGLVWWNVRAASGNEGWAVEGADNIQTLIPVAVTLRPFESGEPFASLCSVALGENAISGTNTVVSNPTVAPPPATPVPSPTIISTPVSCPGLLPSRMIIGQQGQVLPGDPNNVRSEPNRNASKIGEIPSGGTFFVLDGPICADGYAWWQVDFNGLVGWTAESGDGVYWIEPVNP